MDPFLAEIRIFGFNFAPRGWATCDGQLLPISQNTALFALLGTVYGGDGKTTFALPKLNGAAPMAAGTGPDGTDYFPGETVGSATVNLIQSELPLHSHSLSVSTRSGSEKDPTNQALAVGQGIGMYGANNQPTTLMGAESLSITGGSMPHNNMQPSLAFTFCIAMQGIFPPRG
ncbi:MAG: tail fiber protein [Actinomycetota bacterium]|nr:tail fiber protein [Actinomycetota bacterium]